MKDFLIDAGLYIVVSGIIGATFANDLKGQRQQPVTVADIAVCAVLWPLIFARSIYAQFTGRLPRW